MAILEKLMGRKPAAGSVGDVAFAPVLKDRAKEDGEYAVWIRNHRWTPKNEQWCRRQMEKFTYRPTLGVLMQCRNPKLEFLKESLSSIFNQVYPFHELSIVDRGSTSPDVRALLESLQKDPRVKVSFQKGTDRDQEAIAKIMKKTAAEWLLLMGAEDILEPNALYDMVATLQNTVEIDFVFADSDLLDEQGLRFDPQFKPIWAVGAHYPLGFYQHPILLHERLVHKLRGHERVSALMDEGTLLDEASNHSRYVLQSPGIPYHARARGLKNETPPPPVWNVLINDNFIQKDNRIAIDPEARIRTEPRVPLKILWITDSLESGDAELHLYYLARFMNREMRHSIHFLCARDGAMRSLFEAFAGVSLGAPDKARIEQLHREKQFDAVVVTSFQEPSYPEVDLPGVWQIVGPASDIEKIRSQFVHPATVVFSSETIAAPYRSLDSRGTARLLTTSVDYPDLKLFKQRTSPIDLRAGLKIGRTALVFSCAGPTIEERGQKLFVRAALDLLQRHPSVDAEFFLLGERPGAYLDELKSMIGASANANRFHFVADAVDPVKRYPYIWISDVVVTCAASEPYPMHALEAMAFKKAVIGPKSYAFDEFVEHDENGLLYEPGNADSLRQEMEHFVTQRDLAEAMGRISLETSMEKFTLKKSALRMERYIRESIVYVP